MPFGTAFSFLAVVVLLDTNLHADPTQMVLDMNMAGDWDDVGALAVLNALANYGECQILAVVTNRKDATRASAAAVDAINTWYGRPAIPIGTDEDGAKTRHQVRSPYTEALRDEFPNDAPPEGEMPDALDVYRQTLTTAPDGRVTICSMGALSNLEDLLRAEPELVKRKVRRLVVMGGEFLDSPSNRPETNIILYIAAARYVIDKWPCQIIFTGFKVGKQIPAGSDLQPVTNRNTVRRAYVLRPYEGRRSLDGGKPAYDQTAVLLAVRGIEREKWNKSRPDLNLSATRDGL